MAYRSVMMFKRSGGWVVAVTADGEESVRSFKSYENAKSYADEHRIRLGLPVTDNVIEFQPKKPTSPH
ncbi:hypothetical protein [Shinella curvata]|uniref:hypothetical protein n=1 Tax=Shinella curvata TaxID=1817964 RepID=UPI001FD486D9|nr:hypothetical protein [Shinella curvata]